MPKQTHLMRRDGRYYFRRVVPKELRDAIGKREIKLSLRTSDHRKAEELARVKAVEVDARFAEARVKSQPENVLDLSEMEIRQMTLVWFQEEEKQAEEDFSKNPDRIFNDHEAPHEVRREHDFEESIFTDVHDLDQQATVQQVAKRLLEDRNASLKFSDPNFQLLCELVRRGMIEGVRRSRQRFTNNFSKSFFDDLFEGITGDTRIAETPKQKRISFSQLVVRYTDDPSRAHLTQKSKDADKAKFKALTELIGSAKLLHDVTRDDCRDVRAVLIKLPTNATKKFPGQPLRNVVDIGGQGAHEVLSTKTVNSYLDVLSALFKYAVKEDYLDKNPSEGLQLPNKGSRKNDRLPFSTDQLKAIFNAPLYTGCKNDQAAYATPGPNVVRRGRFWTPLIALYSGMRLNEICQLRVGDIVVKDGVDVILVTLDGGDDDKSLKSDAATRCIPIHPELKNLGFLDYVKSQREKGGQRLFPELPKGAGGYYSDPFQKWFSGFLEKANAKAPKTSFHSFRHNFRDALREANVNQEAVLALGGWAGNGGTSDIYGSGLRADTLARAMAKISYEGLDLEHLRN